MLGQRPGAVLQGPGSCPEAKARMRAALHGGEPFTGEILNYTREGRAFWVSLDVSPVHDSKGTLSGYVGVQTDITERKRADELLRAARDAAEESAARRRTSSRAGATGSGPP
jgi:PAS domain S-box-containing protein